MTAQKDMTVGDPAKIVLNFSIPVILGNLFQSFYSMTDTVIVGQFVGTGALASVGATGTITFLILGFTWGLCSGFTVPMGQRFGAGDMRGMRKAAGNALTLTALFSAVITVAALLSMRALMNLMHTPEDIYADAYHYVMILCAGLFAQTMYTILSSAMRTLGDSRDPLFFLILSAGLNIVLDLVFIIVFHMGVAGAAWATVISQAVAGIGSFLFIWKKMPILHLSRSDFALDPDLVKLQLAIGIPMALQFSITAIGAVMLQSALNLLGSTAVAAYTAGSKIEQLLDQLFIGLGVTMASYCSQNAGAGRIDRVKKGILAADRQGFACAVAAGIGLLSFGKYLTYLFISDDLEQIVPMVDTYLRCCSFFLIPLAAIFIYRNALQGMGYSLMPMMAGVVELFARAAVAFGAGRSRSFFGVCLANPAAWGSAALFLYIAYRVQIRKTDRLFKGSDAAEKAARP